MSRKSLNQLPDIFVSNKDLNDLVTSGLRAGKLRKLASRLYTKDLRTPPETLVRRNIWAIAGAYFPGDLIADRTGLEGAPAKDGSIFLVSGASQSEITLPGYVLYPRRGSAPLDTDIPFMDVLRLSSPARALLDNFVPSRSRKGTISRTRTKAEMSPRASNASSFRPSIGQITWRR